MNYYLSNNIMLIYLIMFFTFIIINPTLPQSENESVPDWAKEVVWYQIFPERFCNADKSNDPTPQDMKGAWPYNIPENWQIHP